MGYCQLRISFSGLRMRVKNAKKQLFFMRQWDKFVEN